MNLEKRLSKLFSYPGKNFVNKTYFRLFVRANCLIHHFINTQCQILLYKSIVMKWGYRLKYNTIFESPLPSITFYSTLNFINYSRPKTVIRPRNAFNRDFVIIFCLLDCPNNRRGGCFIHPSVHILVLTLTIPMDLYSCIQWLELTQRQRCTWLPLMVGY